MTAMRLFLSSSRDLRERAQHIGLRNRLRGRLNAVHRKRHLLAHLAEQLILQIDNLLLCVQHGVLILLELLCDIALTVCERLLSNIVIRHLRGLQARYFDIIAKDAVVTDLQLGDAGRFALALFNRRDLALSAGGDIAQFVQLRAVALADKPALAQGERQLLDDRGVNQRLHIAQLIHRIAQDGEQIGAARAEQGADLRNQRDGLAECAQVAAVCRTVHHPSDQALHVERPPQDVRQVAAHQHIVLELADRLLTCGDEIRIQQRLAQPLAQHTRAHRGLGVVDYPQQRAFFLLAAESFGQLKVAPRIQVETHKRIAA